ncbi:unnamed protein product [Cuscuta campestris]|uniref:Uncharacterized protein n=1 Tax=Cuscuta campestris TaxID=132261 RepID=A0A484KIL3_9ASTE|nr:unnamed protein product [Cuscuta campestris]
MDLERDRDRPPYHRTPSINSGGTTATGELLVCFASRLPSSSSMKLSKSILSPGRSRDPSVSLSTSLSRRLRSNGSIKAGQASPMFPKKRGSAFENPEPSSPKVTCIGQVRVKTKKKVKHTRSLSNRRGDLSFRKLDQGTTTEDGSQSLHSLQGQRSSSVHYQECVPHRNQRWVHLPLTICEALRTFGAEFSCLFPCRSSCFSPNERDKAGKENGSKDGGNGEPSNEQQHRSCGAVLARWLVAVQEDGVGEKEREIELVVAGGDEEEERIGGRPSTAMPSSRSRRHVFEDFDLKGETFQEHNGEDGETVVAEEENARVSICIPPKNALLLMRCRSDPMKMAALTNRFWETPSDFTKNEDPKGEEDIAVEEQEESHEPEVEVLVVNDECAEELADEYNASSSVVPKEDPNEETPMAEEAPCCEKEETQVHPEEEAKMETDDHKQKDVDSALPDSHIDHHHHQSSIEDVSSQINDHQPVGTDDPLSSEQEEKEESTPPPSSSSSSQINSPDQHCEGDDKLEASIQELTEETNRPEFGAAADEAIVEEPDAEIQKETLKKVVEEQEKDEEENVTKLSKKEDALPDCLLLMMCEPKLSMEVSKETWVCSTDFVRWMPERPPQAKARKKDTTVNKRPQQQQDRSRQLLLQPVRRSSCSLPPRSSVSGGSMASLIEQKLVNAMAYEPFVLTRCKSEPMRTAAAKLAPEPCFWKDRKLLEPHRRATFGFGAAGVGF